MGKALDAAQGVLAAVRGLEDDDPSRLRHEAALAGNAEFFLEFAANACDKLHAASLLQAPSNAPLP